MDLILITPKASPPVARIINYDKFRYEEAKRLKKERKKAPDMKRIQITVRSQKNDLSIRLKKLEEFLKAGHRVEIQLVMKGREKGKREWADNKLAEFMETIETPHKVTSNVKRGGRGLLVQIRPE